MEILWKGNFHTRKLGEITVFFIITVLTFEKALFEKAKSLYDFRKLL